MISFKKMWDDVMNIINNGSVENVEILEKYNEGFLIKNEKESCFLSKDDFVDFWCNMLYFNEVSSDKVYEKHREKFKYIYEVVKDLPYMNENCGILKLLE